MEREGYIPEELDLNGRIPAEISRQFRDFMAGYDNIPFAIDPDGYRVQPDQPMIDDFDEAQRKLGRDY